MKRSALSLLSCLAIALTASCGSSINPSGWPVTVAPSSESVSHMKKHVKFTGSNSKLTSQEKALLTFLDEDENIAKASGKKMCKALTSGQQQKFIGLIQGGIFLYYAKMDISKQLPTFTITRLRRHGIVWAIWVKITLVVFQL